MELPDFLLRMRADIKERMDAQLADSDAPCPVEESVFTEIVMEHMAEVGMTDSPVVCHFERKVGPRKLRLSGYAISPDSDRIDFFVSIYGHSEEVQSLPTFEAERAAEECIRFVSQCVEGKLAARLSESEDVYPLVLVLQEVYASLTDIRVFVVTDQQTKSKRFVPREVMGKMVQLEVMDIERLFRHRLEGRPRETVEFRFEEPLPCIRVPGLTDQFYYLLTSIPGAILRSFYVKYGRRLFAPSARSYLGAKSTHGRVGRGLATTLRDSPSRFMAYNRGLSVLAQAVDVEVVRDDMVTLRTIRGASIVDGAQTTAAMHFRGAQKHNFDLSNVNVPVTILVVMSSPDEAKLEAGIARFANSINKRLASDDGAAHPFFCSVESLAWTTFCPSGLSRWYFERMAGAYRESRLNAGTSLARRHKFDLMCPKSQLFTRQELVSVLTAWSGNPSMVCRSSNRTMECFLTNAPANPSQQEYTQIVAKVIVTRAIHASARKVTPSSSTSLAAYATAIFADRGNDRLDLDKIWHAQGISAELRELLSAWTNVVHGALESSRPKGTRITEWKKRPECWDTLRSVRFDWTTAVPEIRLL